jgi:hypothetical protein
MKSRKVLSFLLALVLILGMSTTPAFAAWPSFQNDSINNGVTTTQPDITSPAVPTQVQPQYRGDLFVGIDAPPVMNGGRAYTLYNGGETCIGNGGARLSAVDVTTAAEVWNIQLDGDADNVFQLSTSYLDTANNNIYAGVTYYQNQLASTDVTGWEDSSNVPLTEFSFPANTTTTIHYDNLVISSDYWEPQLVTDINFNPVPSFPDPVLTAQVTLDDGTNTYSFPTSTYFGGNWTMFNSGGPMIPAGTYTLTVSITTLPDIHLYACNFEFITSYWRFYRAAGVNTSTPPAVTLLESGYGQANTPIYRNGTDDYLYFGIYEGDRSYYQYQLSTGTLTQFKPTGGDDFYWAGALAVTVGGTPSIAFGSDSGTVYARPVGGTFGSAADVSINLVTDGGVATAGAIRSTLCLSGTFAYFTSQGTVGNNGRLWRVDASGNLSNVTLAGRSVSTPVVSANGFIYVGSEGGVQVVPVSTFANPVTVFSGGPVTASPIVYSISTGSMPSRIDYIFFTTNAFPNGTAYCYSRAAVAGTITQVWSAAAMSSALQGFAADGGYLIYGDDSNRLYVFAP